MRIHWLWVAALLCWSCTFKASIGTSSGVQTHAGGSPGASGPYCSVLEGQSYCFPRADQKRFFDEDTAREAERKRLFDAAEAEKEAQRQAVLDEQRRLAKERSAADDLRHQAEAKARDDQRAAEIDRLKLGGPVARAAAIAKCALDQFECPGDADDPSGIYEAAGSEVEVRRLAVRFTALQTQEARRREAEERRDERADAPLVCRDGELSPSCTCGGSRRGCCSHHGGVRGCSAD